MPFPDYIERFVSELEALVKKEDRATLAALRRGLGRPPGQSPEMYPFIVPRIPHGASPRLEDAFYTVAALFAAYPCPSGEGNLGRTFAQILAKSPSESIEKRFTNLLNCHEEDLPDHLRHAVSLARSKEVPINWRQLMADLLAWNHPDRYVQRQWAKAFWGYTHHQEDSEKGE